MKLRYSEASHSVQGEGKFVGVPRIPRTFGCNLSYELWHRRNKRPFDFTQRR